MLAAKRPLIDAYRNSLSGAPSTVARKLSAMSSFYACVVSAEAVAAETVRSNPGSLVKRAKVDADTSSTQGLTVEQARALLRAAREDGPCSYALLSLLLGAGVRIGEALGADTGAYAHDAGHRVLKVTRKGGKRASVVLPALAVGALDAYLGTTASDLVLAVDGAVPIFTTATVAPLCAAFAPQFGSGNGYLKQPG